MILLYEFRIARRDVWRTDGPATPALLRGRRSKSAANLQKRIGSIPTLFNLKERWRIMDCFRDIRSNHNFDDAVNRDAWKPGCSQRTCQACKLYHGGAGGQIPLPIRRLRGLATHEHVVGGLSGPCRAPRSRSNAGQGTKDVGRVAPSAGEAAPGEVSVHHVSLRDRQEEVGGAVSVVENSHSRDRSLRETAGGD